MDPNNNSNKKSEILDSVPKVYEKSEFLKRILKLLGNVLLEVTIIATTWFMSYIPLLLIYLSEFILISLSKLFNVKTALRCVAELWIRYLHLWHKHSVVGIHNIPAQGPGLIVWYHGPVPVDYIGLVARLYQDTGRMVVSVTDRSLEMLPGLDMFRHHMKVGPFTKIEIAELLDGGELVGVAPGGARECLFDHNCEVLWGNRTGFAKVATLTRVPIIPVYTENIRYAYRTVQTGSCIWRAFWERFRVPVTLIYGGFPVQLTTHIGAPICRIDGESYLQLQERVRVEIKNMISLNQRNKSVIEAVTERFPSFL